MNYLYQEKLPGIRIKTNSCKHRKHFNWQDLYTINPYYTLKAWELAHYCGYRYPEVDFNNLTCLEKAETALVHRTCVCWGIIITMTMPPPRG